MRDTLFFDWSVSALTGWGVYGLNLLRWWKAASGDPAYGLHMIHVESFAGMDGLRLMAIARAVNGSDEMRRKLESSGPAALGTDGILLRGLAKFGAADSPAAGLGVRTIAAVTFFEDTHMPDAARECARYGVVVAGSGWCEQVLRANGASNVATVLQGIDPSVFHPAPRFGALDGRFAVFSGGKMERRKGQDLVMLAFRAFAGRHPEAVLVTAWHSPWPGLALSVNRNDAVPPVRLTEAGQLDVPSWAVANGLREGQLIDLGSVPNHLMGGILREMDVAVFPNRCEGGTNLVAMECMACGVPTIVSNNTGHLDLVATGAPFALTRQSPVVVQDTGCDGWGESDVDEIVEALEHAWADREEARRRGEAGARAMAGWSWRDQIARLHGVLAAA